jgi:bifunctional non-homologous end joining protein LigD
MDRLEEYRRKRDSAKTPEPVPEGPPPRGNDDTFVIQQHHARRLHWDLRLERNGVLVSWAVPRGIPRDPAENHLAVHTEDHPLEYATFHGQIPAGEYGGGRMTIYDRGTYETEKWSDREVMVVLHGNKVNGRYVLFRTRGDDWMIHRMDPAEPGWTRMPEIAGPMRPMKATRLPDDDEAWAYELHWDGIRALGYVSGGRLRLDSDGQDVIGRFPELRQLADVLAPTECVLDGEVVAFEESGRVSRAALEPRLEAAEGAPARRLAARVPVQYLLFDLLWLDGRALLDLPYAQRRELLDGMDLTGAQWLNPPYFVGAGESALETSRAQGSRGVVAKRLDSPYTPGRRSRDWLLIANTSGARKTRSGTAARPKAK